MKYVAFPFLIVTSIAMLGACGSSDQKISEPAGVVASSPSRSSGSTTGTTASSGDKIGVPECDDFFAKYEACLSEKVPEAARASWKSNMMQWKDSWRRLANDPQTRSALAATCRQAREQQEVAMKAYGCEW